MNMNIYKIYILEYNNNIVYVGRTKLKRLCMRKAIGYPKIPKDIVKECKIQLIEETTDPTHEIFWINYFRDKGCNLYNYKKIDKKEILNKQKEYNKEFRDKNPEYMKEWLDKNREKWNNYKKEWLDKNPEYMKEWLDKNREKWNNYQKEYMKEWLDKNREKWNNYQKEYKRNKKL